MFYRHLVSLLNYFTFIILECQNEYSAKASNNIEQLRKRTNEPSSPSDSFFDLKDDSFAQELVKTYGEPHHSGTGQAGSLDKDDEVSSKAQEWKPPYVYKARKKSSEYDTSKTATASRNYLERIRSDPIKLERYRFKKAQIRSERLIKQGKVPFPRERRRIEVPFKELIQLEKDKIINEKQKEELAYHRAKRSQRNRKYYQKHNQHRNTRKKD